MKRLKLSKKQVAILKEILSDSKLVVIAFAIAFVCNHVLIINAEVPTGSMESTVMTGSKIIVNRLAYVSADPQRGDIITFKYPDNEKENYLKRIIALPGETVEGKDGVIYINEEPLEENYIKEISYLDFGPYVVPEDCYFMMGDNRNNSLDSRYWINKFVSRDAILGKAEFEYYPEIKSLKLE